METQQSTRSLIDAKPVVECGPPVFIVGSARSGNTLLYDTLLSSGHFAVYRTEPVVFDLLVPKFGDLSRRKNRDRLLSVWFQTYQYRISGLDRPYLAQKILDECHSAGEFLRIVMDEVARQQAVPRWAVWGPDNLLHIPEITKTIPNALFLHMIRDGRDVALSMFKKGWIRPFPWDRKRGLIAAALHWRWKVERGRHYGQKVGQRYLEIHFEDLVCRPIETLTRIGRFVRHEFDYQRIRQTSMGTLRQPNSTFKGVDSKLASNPVGRWRKYLSESEVSELESIIGPLLAELGYPLEFQKESARGLPLKLMQGLYPCFYDFKEWLRMKTPLGRFVSTSRLRFDDAAPR